MKTNTPFLIMQHGGSGGMAKNFPPLSPHVIFIFRVSVFFEKKFSSEEDCAAGMPRVELLFYLFFFLRMCNNMVA
jgi:hypothetical protein